MTVETQAEAPWSVPVRLDEALRGPQVRRLAPDAEARARIAKALNLVGLPAFEGEVRIRPWSDGAELDGRWSARAVYSCGLTLEPFEDALEGSFRLRVVLPDSPHAAPAEAQDELEIDPDADDPPDVLEAGTIDFGAYLVEHLSLELDPFPRKPGAVFEPPPAEAPESPFAVLKALRKD